MLGVTDEITLQILVTIGSGVLGEAWIEFPTFPLTYAVVLKRLWHCTTVCQRGSINESKYFKITANNTLPRQIQQVKLIKYTA